MYDSLKSEVMDMLLSIDKKETGKQIRRIMEETGYTCKDIQNYLSLSCVQTVYRWLDGTNLPTLDNLYALSKLMGKPLDAFVVGAYAPDYSSIHIKEKQIHFYYA